jgi:hypothetical protein
MSLLKITELVVACKQDIDLWQDDILDSTTSEHGGCELATNVLHTEADITIAFLTMQRNARHGCPQAQ